MLVLAPLPGCRSLPAPQNLPHHRAEAALIPASTTIPLPDGAAAPTRLYQPARPGKPVPGKPVPGKPVPGRPVRGVILAFHGFGDSRDAWEVMAPALTRAGYLLVAPDARGFGGFPTRDGWSSTQRMVADGVAEARWCRQHWPGQPLTIMGESMGGALALLVSTALDSALPSGPASPGTPPPGAAASGAAASGPSGTTRTATMPDKRKPHDMAGTGPHGPPLRLILLAPAIMDIGEPWETMLEGWHFLTPHMVLTGANLPGHHVATRNLRALRRFFFDPLTHHGTNVHAVRGLVRLMARAAHQAKRLRVPTLLIWGDRDQFVPASATRRFIRHAPPEQLRLDELPRGYHLITREPDDRPAQDILSWLDDPARFLPSGGDSAASTWLWLEENR